MDVPLQIDFARKRSLPCFCEGRSTLKDLSYDLIWHSAIELRVATATPPGLRINQHLAQIKTKGNQRPEVGNGVGSAFGAKKTRA